MGYGALPASPARWLRHNQGAASTRLLVLLPGSRLLSVWLPPRHPPQPGRIRDVPHSPTEGLGIRPGAECGLARGHPLLAPSLFPTFSNSEVLTSTKRFVNPG